MHKSAFVRLLTSKFSISGLELLESATVARFRCAWCKQLGTWSNQKSLSVGSRSNCELCLFVRDQRSDISFSGEFSAGLGLYRGVAERGQEQYQPDDVEETTANDRDQLERTIETHSRENYRIARENDR